jgi:type I restriction enzyme M protein
MREIVEPTALLLFLRWLDQHGVRQGTEAAIERGGEPEAYPKELQWRIVRDLHGERLTKWLRDVTQLVEQRTKESSAYLQRYIGHVVTLNASPHEETRYITYLFSQLQELPAKLRDALIEIIANLPFDTIEDRQATESLLAAIIARGRTPLSAFYIPPEAVEVIIELAQPRPGERVYDPCFSSGSLLVHAARRLQENAKSFTADQQDEMQRTGLFGIEQDPQRFFVGLVRVILAGIEHPHLELGDALEQPRLKSVSREGFDCIVAIPPWRRSGSSPTGGHVFEVPTRSSEGLFVQHIVSRLRPGGRAVIALPSSFLSSAGSERRVRRLLLENFHVEGVIGLPAKLFKPYYSVESAAIVVRREQAATNIKFMRVDKIAATELDVSVSGAVSPSQIADRFQLGKTDRDLWHSTSQAIAKRDWNLSPRPTGEAELQWLLDELLRVDPSLRVMPLASIAEIIPGVRYRREEIDFDYPHGHGKPMLVRAGDIRDDGTITPGLVLLSPTAPEKWLSSSLRAGDIVLSSRGTIGKIGLVGDLVEGCFPSSNVTTIRAYEERQCDFYEARRRVGMTSFSPLLNALGLRCLFVEVPEQTKRLKSRLKPRNPSFARIMPAAAVLFSRRAC